MTIQNTIEVNPYEAKQEARRERLLALAEKAEAGATAAYNRSGAATAGIPLGQPILVGHHSERRHRSALKRSDNAMRRSLDLAETATRLTERAASVGAGGISSDDPDAVRKLEDKRTDLERRRDNMKKANAWFKKHTTLEGCDIPASMVNEAVANMRIWNGVYSSPFPSYALTNIGARIRQASKRSKQIESTAAMDATEETIKGVEVQSDPIENRVLLRFPDRLAKDEYKKVRSRGFVWSSTRTAFVGKLSRGALQHARALADNFGAAGT